ncbi:uncharacterized protein LOC116253181 [Nymphaea colorata]|uniref:uncharacterized protein LOC116253181 n=1 Tax=Nymphaea colorata TaxID=210225 RepID=UPI00214EA1A9|nr:uncharacterized protein LOC116253181 [Nymphaea colorata]
MTRNQHHTLCPQLATHCHGQQISTTVVKLTQQLAEQDLIGSCEGKNDLRFQALQVPRNHSLFTDGFMFCLVLSSPCHLFGFHFHRLAFFLAHLPCCYHNLWCVHCLNVSLLLPLCSSSEFRSIRALLFITMDFSDLITVVSVFVCELVAAKVVNYATCELSIAFLYSAWIFYLIQVPEKWMPGKFDLTGQWPSDTPCENHISVENLVINCYRSSRKTPRTNLPIVQELLLVRLAQEECTGIGNLFNFSSQAQLESWKKC